MSEAGLLQFLEAYAKDKKLTQIEVGMLGGALTSTSIKKLPGYNEFILTLGTVAPQLLGVIEMANKDKEPKS